MSGSNSSSRAERLYVPDEPLGLTVHSLPAPQEVLASDAQRTARGRLRMLAVLLVIFASELEILASIWLIQLRRVAPLASITV